jgi:hypothetical protein
MINGIVHGITRLDHPDKPAPLFLAGLSRKIRDRV